jgi:UDPglucose 6-dehydrogenase/GDP-mannose 6-dehydrogenase
MNISIIGTGYVGLVTGACLADRGHTVICVDVDPARVEALNAGRSPIFERGLDELLQRNVGRRLRATSDLAAAVHQTEVTFIAVGTPFNGRTIDLTAVLGAAREIGTALKDKPEYHLVVVKSTVVPGTTDLRVRPELEAASGKECGLEFGLGMNPEFLSEGDAVHDFMFPDRIVLGGVDWRSNAHLAEVYRPFAGAPQISTNTRTAELIKYSSNALLATLISFSNEIANLGAALGDIDPVEVMHALHLSQYFRGRNRAGLPPITSFLHPGPGFGGSCLPKDVKALIAHGRSVGEPMRVLEAVITTNEQQPDRLVQILKHRWPELQGIRITILGLAFKPQTNDVRESPAFPVIRALLDCGARVTAFDPIAMPDFRRALPDARIRYAEHLADALTELDAAVVITPWPQFAELPDLLKGRQPAPLVVDSRRAYSPKLFADYAGIGA